MKRMSDRVFTVSHDQKHNSLHSFVTILIESLKLLFLNKFLYSSIFLFLTFPLSLYLFSLSLFSLSTQTFVFQLQYAAVKADMKHLAYYQRLESRHQAVSLFRLKLLFCLPTCILSLLSTVILVATTEFAYNRRPISLKSIISIVRSPLLRLLVTSICMYVVMMVHSSIVRVLIIAVGGDDLVLRLAVSIIGSGLEVYLVSIIGMALVVSSLDSKKRFGVDAVWVGFSLMEGRRISGWVLSALVWLVTGWVRWRVDGGDWSTVMEIDCLGLAGLYGVVILWGHVIYVVFYCECLKQRSIGDEVDERVRSMQAI